MDCLLCASTLSVYLDATCAIIIVPVAILFSAALLARFVVIRHEYLMMFVGFALIVFGCVVYFRPGEILEPACRTFSSFFPSRGDFESSYGESWYFLFHACAIVYLLSLLLAFFGIGLVNRLFIAMRKVFRRRLEVFWGYCDEARCLAGTMDDRGRIVFALRGSKETWLELQDNEAVHVLAKDGWKWIYGTPDNSALLCADRHFFLSPNGHENVASAEILMKELEARACPREVSIYVRAWSEADDDVLYKWADGWNSHLLKEKIDASIEIVREEAIVSRKFLVDHPMLDCPGIGIDTESATVSGEFRVLVVGFGIQGERLAADMICDAQFLGADGQGVPISVDAVDASPLSYGWFKENCAEAYSRYIGSFQCFEAGGELFWEWIKKQLPYNRIVVCTQSDEFNLELANDIANHYMADHREFRQADGRDKLKNTIFARVRDHSLSVSIKDGHVNGEDSYQIFGDSADTYDARTLLNDRWDAGAVFINGVWNASPPEGTSRIEWYKANKNLGIGYWREQSTFNRESSRASFMNLRNILRLMGYAVFPTRPSDEEIARQGLREVPSSQIREMLSEKLNEKCGRTLAESEHRRWMAFHFVRGWKRWVPDEGELRDLSADGTRCVKPNSMKNRARIHANLVDFKELDDVDEVFNAVNRANGQPLVDSKKKDDDIVSGLEAIYDAGFFVARKKEGSE